MVRMLTQLEQTLFDRPYAYVLIAEVVNDPMPNKPVGFALYYYAYSTWTSRPTLFLEDLFVLKEYRNHGLGKRLFRHLGEIAKKENCPRIEWNVLTWNEYVSKLTQTIHCLLQGDVGCTDARGMAWHASRRQRNRPPRDAVGDRGVTGRHLKVHPPSPQGGAGTAWCALATLFSHRARRASSTRSHHFRHGANSWFDRSEFCSRR